MRVFFGVILILAGIFVIAFWGAGSHGHMRFRSHKTEDWFFLTSSLILPLVGLFLLFYKVIEIN